MIERSEPLEAKRKYGWVILLADEQKNPSISGKWKRFTTQTEEELQELLDRVGDRASCWGPVCGLGELFSFDFDWPFIYGLWHKHFGERAQTLTYETPNTGARPFFLTKEKTKGDPFETSLHTEFKQSHFVVCGGHAHNVDGELRPYELAMDKPIRRDDKIIQDSTKFFYELLDGRYSWLRYKCIRERLNSKRIVLTHKQGLAINGFMLIEGSSDWEIHNFRRACYDVDEAGKHRLEYDHGATQTQIDSGRKFIKGGGKPFPCRPTETNEGLAAVFDFDPEKCEGCPRREKRTEVRGPGSFFTRRPDGSLGSFVPKRLADTLLKDYRFAATGERSKVWVYNPSNGIWEDNGIEIIQENTTKLLAALFKNIHVTEVSKYIRYVSYISPNLFGGSTGTIVVKNGVLNIHTSELTPFDPELYEIACIPVKYDPTVECPKIIQFLDDVLTPGWDVTIYELVGYTMLKGYPIARIFIFHGSGGNGKSQLIVIIKNFLGERNVSSVTLHQLSINTFASAQLHGKLANLCADIPATPIKYTGAIKTLTGGGDTITAHYKYYALFDFVNYAKLIFSANEVPPTTDNTPAWLRRPILVDFPNVFPAGDPGTIMDLGDKLSTDEELSGLLNLALAGLQRLLKNGKFSNEESLRERAEKYIIESNPAQYFCTQFIAEASSTLDKIEKGVLYKAYVQLCHALRRRPLASNKFSQEIPLYLPYIDDGEFDKVIGKTKTGKPRTRKTRVWYGIRLRKHALEQAIAELKIKYKHRYDIFGSPQNMQPEKTIVHKIEGKENNRIDRIDNNEIVEKAIEILEEAGGEIFQKMLFDELKFRGYSWEEASPILRADPRFNFRGMMVSLRESE